MSAEAGSEDFLERLSEASALALIGHQSKEMLQRQMLNDALLKTNELIKEVPIP
ncbi:hypothetical protein MUN88_02110 [Gracilibacillus caseinilyticus]|uniref:Uncharacterized protein n=1 Tax=Gracilibacillus caseinilyticus TaxID=2932256 RepID=A0ABY4EX10_9BACI|nr:hypothetical protein [Gracilibacillus caseinilyticus]UOQ48954.1 hypothetical protein MUN88_02110 [Gracilibacillus caseinilyticus]